MDKRQCLDECPLKDKNYKTSEGFGNFDKQILFVAHRGDERILNPVLFGNQHEQIMLETDSGKALSEILYHCNLKIENIKFTNILKCVLPQKEKIPEKAYICCERNLKNEIESLSPKAIVCFGKQCFDYMFPEYAGENFLHEAGKIHLYNNKPVLIIHHLSKIYRLQKPNEAEKIRKFLEERL